MPPAHQRKLAIKGPALGPEAPAPGLVPAPAPTPVFAPNNDFF